MSDRSRRLAAVLSAPLALGFALGLTPATARAEGMPQLDFGNPYLLWQVVWGAVIFAVFYILLSRSALPRVTRVLENRQQRVEGDLAIARRAREDADRAVEDLRRARHEASVEAQANIDRVVQDARQAAEVQAREMNKRLQGDITAAEEQIAASRRDAIAKLPEIATETAVELASHMLRPAGATVADERIAAAVNSRLGQAA